AIGALREQPVGELGRVGSGAVQGDETLLARRRDRAESFAGRLHDLLRRARTSRVGWASSLAAMRSRMALALAPAAGPQGAESCVERPRPPEPIDRRASFRTPYGGRAVGVFGGQLESL